jgi:predicted NUDIX family NTP pyrophosphohydrolase
MKTSAGLLMYRRVGGELEVMLAHPGGPFFRNKDDGAWTLPKGELALGEDPEACAVREFREETGIDPGAAKLVALGEVTQRGGKRVLAWAFEASPALVLVDPPPSNTFELEWPPKSGRRVSFPEIDRVAFFSIERARQKLLASQVQLLDRALAVL